MRTVSTKQERYKFTHIIGKVGFQDKCMWWPGIFKSNTSVSTGLFHVKKSKNDLVLYKTYTRHFYRNL